MKTQLRLTLQYSTAQQQQPPQPYQFIQEEVGGQQQQQQEQGQQQPTEKQQEEEPNATRAEEEHEETALPAPPLPPPMVFGACVMIMDENHRLPEWLAYHYYMLPLRHLVLLVDPRSETSPMEIVHRWRNYMTIDVWNFTHVQNLVQSGRRRVVGPVKQNNNNKTKNLTPDSFLILTSLHRTIQPQFMNHCALYLRQQHQPRYQQAKINNYEEERNKNQQSSDPLSNLTNATTTTTTSAVAATTTTTIPSTNVVPPLVISFHDIDEYMALDVESVPDAVERMSQPGSIGTFLDDLSQLLKQQHPPPPLGGNERLHNQTNDDHHNNKVKDHADALEVLPPAQQQRLLQLPNHTKKVFLSYAQKSFSTRCFVIPRSQFGATERPVDDSPQTDVPEYLHLRNDRFETLRFLHRARHTHYHHNRVPKTMVIFGNNNNGNDDTKTPSLESSSSPQQQSSSSLLLSWSRETLNFTMDVHYRVSNCPKTYLSHRPIRLRHYMGSWETYASRVDSRIGDARSRELFLYRSTIGQDTPPDDAIRPWLAGFCQFMNHNQSIIAELFQGVGELPPPSEQVKQVIWNFTPKTIVKKIEKGHDRLLARWLQQHYKITNITITTSNNTNTNHTNANHTSTNHTNTNHHHQQQQQQHTNAFNVYTKGNRQYIITIRNPNTTETYPYRFLDTTTTNKK